MKKDKKIELRVTEEEKHSISQMAKSQGVSTSEFILNSILNSNSHVPGTFELGIVGVKQYPNLKLSYNQVTHLIESLFVYKEYIQNCKNPKKPMELENNNELITFLEDIINYNFEDVCNKCRNKFAKKYIKDDPGQETFSWL